MKITKRDCSEVEFDKNKIYEAIMKAMTFGSGIIKPDIAKEIAAEIESEAHYIEDLDIYRIESMVFEKLIGKNETLTAKAYEGYRRVREFQRDVKNSTDESIMELLTRKSDYWNEENSNKNAMLVTTQRDYMAGIESEDISKRMLLTPDIIQSHEDGIIHFHDIDYFGQNAIHNCDLINLEDMLQNGTVISGVMIEKPHSFSTACNVATQIIAQVASSQYGGQSISLSHLAPFVDVSRNKIKAEVEAELKDTMSSESEACKKKTLINGIVEKRLRKEIEKGVQTIQYQVVTLMTTNGQAPFLSVFMYLNEVKDIQTKNDLALIIEEVLKQRIQGVRNEKGVWVTPAFPKLLYVLEDDNTYENSKYFYLTKLAAKCSAKRLVPDYISEKIMLENKVDKNGNGHCYPCMGCVDGDEIITYRLKDKMYVESFKRMWDKLSKIFPVIHQYTECNPNLYMDLDGVEIFDTVKGFVNTKRIVRNYSDNWVKVIMSNGRILTCTADHPFATDKGRICAKDLKKGHKIKINQKQVVGKSLYNWTEDMAWAYGLMLCDGSLASTPSASFAITGEDDIISKLKNTVDKYYNINSRIKEQHRENKGSYKDILMPSRKFQYDLIHYFEGIAKKDRHIPNSLFSMDYSVRLAFLAGMIDADGYINNNTKLNKIQIGSTNKELALQQLALMQSLDMPAFLYANHYDKKNPDNIRFRVECVPTIDLINALVCKKKKNSFTNNIRTNSSSNTLDESKVISVEYINKKDYSYDVTTESDHFEVSGIYSHNCRSFLTPYIDKNGQPKYYGRFNQGVVTINLPDIALSSGGDMETFWKLFDARTELCHKALQLRHQRLESTPSDVAPILWQYGAISRLQKGETIDKLLHNGYSTISLGYAGLYECVKYMTGVSHTDGDVGETFGLKVMKALNDKCQEWKEAEHIDYSLYGSPIESTTYKFAKCLRKRFGVIKGITDRDYITNSYHVPVFEEINAFDKLAIESKFQKLSPGGAISYVEIPNMNDNIQVVIQIIQFIYENIMYAELNSKSDYCMVCGYDKEIKIVTDENSGKLIWECPQCGNRDQTKMSVARRTCGYIGSQFWNQGRTQEIKERVLHIDDKEYKEE